MNVLLVHWHHDVKVTTCCKGDSSKIKMPKDVWIKDEDAWSKDKDIKDAQTKHKDPKDRSAVSLMSRTWHLVTTIGISFISSIIWWRLDGDRRKSWALGYHQPTSWEEYVAIVPAPLMFQDGLYIDRFKVSQAIMNYLTYCTYISSRLL